MEQHDVGFVSLLLLKPLISGVFYIGAAFRLLPSFVLEQPFKVNEDKLVNWVSSNGHVNICGTMADVIYTLIL